MVKSNSTHPEAKFPLVFVCSELTSPSLPTESQVNEPEGKVIIEQLEKYCSGWPKDSWGAKLDPSQICVMSPSRTQVRIICYYLRFSSF